MNTMQLGLNLGAKSGVETVDPIAVADTLMTTAFGRVTVTGVSDNIHGAVYVCVRHDNGATCVVLPREISYRSRRA